MNNKFWNAPAWSMGNRYAGKSNKKNQGGNIPGPGTYDLRGDGNQLGCKMGTSSRGFNDRQNNPGPGNYNISTKNDGPKISMATKFDKRGNGTPNYPGPGNYNTSSSIVRPGSGVTIGAKYHTTNALNEQPGPGSYNLGANPKSGVKIGTSKRTDITGKSYIPGPGQYTFDKRPHSAGPKYGFGRAGRGQSQHDVAPGPGYYESTSFVRNGDNNGCTMGYRFKQKGESVALGPGPGYYDADYLTRKHGSGAKIGKAKRGMYQSMASPGPGAYNYGYKSLHGGTKMGTSKRGDFGRGNTPGPGQYETLKQTRGGVTISGHRNKTKADNVPGPGTYNGAQYGRQRPCSANIGTSLRAQMSKSNTPGPGQYNFSQHNSYKFAYTKQLRSKQMKKGPPGPGQYDIPTSVPSAPHYLIDPSIYKSGYGGSNH